MSFRGHGQGLRLLGLTWRVWPTAMCAGAGYRPPWEAVFTIRPVTTAGLALPLRVGVLALERMHLREPAAA
jgi:hypothetical protein